LTAIASDKTKPASVVVPSEPVERPPSDLPAPAPFEETEYQETELHYGPGGFSWFPRVIWLGGVILFAWYVVSFYVPSLRAWASWKPSP